MEYFVSKGFRAIETAMNLMITFSLISMLTASSTMAAALSASEILNKLSAGQCYSDPLSKNYLKSIKPNPERYPFLLRDIGIEKFKNLKDTASTQYYFCQVSCKDQFHQISQIWVTMSDSTDNFSKMDGFLCPHVIVENVNIVGDIYSPQPVPQIFYGFNSSLPEIHRWLLQIDFRLSSPAYEAQWMAAQPDLKKVAKELLNTNAMNFVEAGARLFEIANASDLGVRLLNDYVQRMNLQNWKTTAPPGSVDFLVETFLIANLRFVPYRPIPLISP